ncbi:complement factor H-related protein 1-like [Astyanax mexicanus]|uniref:Complement factor H-related protein 1-like n=1 Tax=Astyanax mexicanus TaxID=7994 RepID=A0A8T2LN81_ASTMX|nr:complement factor H-related protein 1-like [Astyanax mexicanus]
MRIVLFALFCVWLFPDSNNAQACQSPELSQGFLVPQQDVYQHGSKVFYSCDSGLKPALQTWWGELVCENGKWSHAAQCIAVNDCFAPEVPNAKPVQPLQTSYSSNSRVNFSCNKGYQFEEVDVHEAVCTDGQWKLPMCKRKLTACGVPPSVADAVITQPSQNMFDHTDRVEYRCKNGHEMVGQKFSYCMFGVWTPAPQCETWKSYRSSFSEVNSLLFPVRECKPYPTIENGDFIEEAGGRTLKAECASYYKLEGPEQVMCVSGQWSELPVCKAPCLLDQSQMVRSQRPYLIHGEEDQFWCKWGGWVKVKCVDGKAQYEECKCIIHTVSHLLTNTL